jgi:hypothetical protein
LPRVHFPEFLPAVFERTLALDKFAPGGGTMRWIFTGDRGGVTVSVDESAVRVTQRYFDSFALRHVSGAVKGYHPEWRTAGADRWWCRIEQAGLCRSHPATSFACSARTAAAFVGA